MNPAPGVLVAERYRLERPLGQGGMGSVWLAQHVALRTACAVKFLHAQAAEQAEVRARFEREAVAAAQLKSPHVVQIFDHGIWQGIPYIAMEKLDGEDLAHRLQRVRVMPPRDVAVLVAQVARALTKAHAAGLVHRDLKPANIFLCRDDEGEVAKVLDFGVAKVNALSQSDGNTKTGALLGTPFYMSPEQAQGNKAVDHRSDLWALAVVAFQCLTGRLPYSSDALGDLLVKIIVQPPPIPSHVAPVPPGFDAWWARATAHDPAGRFQSAKELADNLAMALAVSASPALGISQPQFPAPTLTEAHPPTPQPAYPPTPQPAYPRTPQPAYPPTPQPAYPPSTGTVNMGTPLPGAPAAPLTPLALPMVTAASAPPRSRAGLIVGTVVGLLVLAGAGAGLFLVRSASPPARPTVGVSAAPSSAPSSSAPASGPASAAPEASAEPGAPGPVPSASASARAWPAGAPAGKKERDVGF
jgi:serine/threonine-protein kinase